MWLNTLILQPYLQALTNPITHFTKFGEGFFFCANKGSRVFKRPVQPLRCKWENGTALFGFAADGDHRAHVDAAQIVHHAFRLMPANVKADIVHGLNGVRIHDLWLKAGTVDLELITSEVALQALGHLAADRAYCYAARQACLPGLSRESRSSLSDL